MKHPSTISISEFTYDLPPEKIAAYPLAKRDESKLLVYNNGEIKETVFRNVPGLLEKDSMLVFNNTRVIQARLNFRNEKDKAIEVFCLEPSGNIAISAAMPVQKTTRWNCLVGNLRQWKEEILRLANNGLQLQAELIERCGNFVIVEFKWDPPGLSFAEVLDLCGAMPIPPYLERKSENIDSERYQTVYARQKGSVAAPTAGLHFTESVLDELKARGIEIQQVTLHVGAGTFKPVKSETMLQHEMHAEWIEVSVETIEEILRNKHKKIIPVGTTSLRTIESLYWMGIKALTNPSATIDDLEVKQWDPYEPASSLPGTEDSLLALLEWMRERKLNRILCKTSILIAPPYELKIAGGLITNFHQPQSTLLLLISAVIGENWRKVYNYALNHDFRFLSYGDSCLLLK
ncbi:MAG: S-adenosylmethionine:tRNA ribosyltransferase-isomerase [Bacteroidota bacterium]